MCGIAGYIDLHRRVKDPEEVLSTMNDALVYRGPDGQGIWTDENFPVYLAHRRLSILDLSSEGKQPMVSRSKRYVITYNGEVYNFQSIRAELEKIGTSFRGHSDTEIILGAIEAWGINSAVTRFIGMFAFSLWDSYECKLYLVRDRLGIKPLYYGEIEGSFVFSSELKSIRTFPGFVQSINRDSIALLLRYGYIPAPHSIYEGFVKLMPGHILSIRISDNNKLIYQDNVYWSAKTVAEQGSENLIVDSKINLVDQLDALLSDSVNLRMLADVPIGAFLSGGIDSSTTTALMQAQSSNPIKTFSIGFHDDFYDEAKYAKQIAQHLGTDHTELYVTPEQAMAVIPKLPELYDEPFADQSQIPTYLVSELARKHVTVSLSGDGGDELFYGYSRYLFAQRIWKKIRWLPVQLRVALGNMASIPLLSDNTRFQLLADVLSNKTQDEFYNRIVSAWKQPTKIVIGSTEPLIELTGSSRNVKLSDFSQRMMFFDLISYLPDDILVKLDRASMGVSLEARVPLLDHRVVEFAWRLPQSLKYNNGQTKWILRQVLYRYVPKDLVERPKKGFGVPIDSWLRGPMRDWAEGLLNEERLKNEGFFHPKLIREKWHEHLSGKRNWSFYLWRILMFQAWLEKNT
ncbi:MAG: asparagine synthase (glutamine-hydrolyzing) [Methylococcales bacterium]